MYYILRLAMEWINHCVNNPYQIARFMGPTWGPHGSCRPHMGPMLAPWTLLSGVPHRNRLTHIYAEVNSTIIGSHNASSHGRLQSVIWTNAALFGIWGTNRNKRLITVQEIPYRDMIAKVRGKLTTILYQIQRIDDNAQIHKPLNYVWCDHQI